MSFEAPSGRYYTVLNAPYALVSQTGAQKLFNGSPNGALSLPVGSYKFECQFALNALSTLAGSFGFGFGGAAIITQSWLSKAVKSALAIASSPNWSLNTAASTALTSSNAGGNGYAEIKGIMRVTTAGTIIPQVSLSTAAAAIVAANSYFSIEPIASSASQIIQPANLWS